MDSASYSVAWIGMDVDEGRRALRSIFIIGLFSGEFAAVCWICKWKWDAVSDNGIVEWIGVRLKL